MPTPRPATLLHTSDVHLDRDDGGHHQQAFAAAIDMAIASDVDAVLIVGDLFDHARVRDDILDWTAHWVKRGGRLLSKPTHFQVRDGSF